MSAKLEVINYGQLRPVNNSEVYVSNRVAYAHYSGCGDNVFVEHFRGSQVSSTCPLGHSSRHNGEVDYPPGQ